MTAITPLPRNWRGSEGYYNTSHAKMAREWGYYNTSHPKIILRKVFFAGKAAITRITLKNEARMTPITPLTTITTTCNKFLPKFDFQKVISKLNIKTLLEAL